MPHFTHNDQRLFYREQGEGRLLLVLPGNTASSACHPAELDYFGQRYRAVSLDFLGTGQSDRIEVWPDDWWEQSARAAMALVDHLGQDQCLVMGTSGGGVVALSTAVLFPERVEAVIADSCVEKFRPDWIRTVISIRNQRTLEQVSFWQHAHGDDWAQVVEADSDLFKRLAERDGDFFNGHLRQICCPVLFIASLQDQALQNVGVQVGSMCQQIPKSRAFLVNEGDHPLMWSKPQLFRSASDAFLASLQ